MPDPVTPPDAADVAKLVLADLAFAATTPSPFEERAAMCRVFDNAESLARGVIDRDKEMTELRAENTRLREALTTVAALPWNVTFPQAFDNLSRATRIAAAALAQGEGEKTT